MILLQFTIIIFFLATNDFSLTWAEDLPKEPGKVIEEEVFVEDFVRHILLTHQRDQELVVVRSGSGDKLMEALVRKLALFNMGVTLIDLSLSSQDPQFSSWNKELISYSAFIIYLPSVNRELKERFLKDLRLYMQPTTRVLLLGERGGQTLLLSKKFENVIAPVYFTVTGAFISPSHMKNGLLEYIQAKESLRAPNMVSSIDVYRRCLYCNSGKHQVSLLQRWYKDAPPSTVRALTDHPKQFFGHKIVLVALKYPPITDYIKSGANITLVDSLDTRLMKVLTETLNFTYSVKEPGDGLWAGRSETGKWKGIIGELVKGDGDVSSVMGTSPERLEVVDFTYSYVEDSFAMLMMKPGFISKRLALFRPLSETVWLILMVTVIIISLLTWILEVLSTYISKGPRLNAAASFSHIWGTLLQNSTAEVPTFVPGKVVMGFWLYSSLVIATAYHSSLSAHLTINQRTTQISSLEELGSQSQLSWSVEPGFYNTRMGRFLKKSDNLFLQNILVRAQILNTSTGIRKVLSDSHVHISWKRYINTIIAENFTDIYGRHPFHVKNILLLSSSTGGAVRKGAPFLESFNDIILHLNEAGITPFWIKDIMWVRVKEAKKKRTMSQQLKDLIAEKVSKGHLVVLTLTHLQGAFILLLLGYIFSLASFFGEKLLFRKEQRDSKNWRKKQRNFR